MCGNKWLSFASWRVSSVNSLATTTSSVRARRYSCIIDRPTSATSICQHISSRTAASSPRQLLQPRFRASRNYPHADTKTADDTSWWTLWRYEMMTRWRVFHTFGHDSIGTSIPHFRCIKFYGKPRTMISHVSLSDKYKTHRMWRRKYNHGNSIRGILV